MLEITDIKKINQVVSDVIEKVAQTVSDDKAATRWVNSINKVADQIEDHGDFMTWNPETKSLLIWNQETNSIHSANGVCDCAAFQKGFPCFHRAAARIVRLYLEPEAREPIAGPPYMSPSQMNSRRAKIGNIWID